MKRINSWWNRLLFFGGKYILISHVFQSMPIYLLLVMSPPVNVINQLHSIFAKFYWRKATGAKNKHWISWVRMFLPKEEGGLSFISIHDVSKALVAKLWWIFRVSTSLWSAYMWNKYCKKLHPILVQGKGVSHIWRRMIMVKKEVEHGRSLLEIQAFGLTIRQSK
ncbi:hypothetical protein RDI58_028966 [Solanum bulbocastanum]|uniref:Uncharacterized protein n=1 Tax=Solanum bulbocastanum TaxID=147425 RepID=A0AAN8Y1N5_SOLBU